MTIERLELRAARTWPLRVALPSLWGAALLVLGCAHGSQARHGDRLDVSAFPPEIQRDYAVFARRCSRCHTLARPLNAQIRDPQHWVRYVTRMRRNPSSGINREDAKLILEFLLFYTAQTQKEEQASEPPRDGEPPQDGEPSQHGKQPQNDEPPQRDDQPQHVEPPSDGPPQDDQKPGPDPTTSTDDAAGATPPEAPASEDALP